MISINQLSKILVENPVVRIAFIGVPKKYNNYVPIYVYNGHFNLSDSGRIMHKEMKTKNGQYSRNISKIIMVDIKNGKLLYGKRCKRCKRPIPKSHGNCFKCYNDNLEESF